MNYYSNNSKKINILYMIDVLWAGGGTERHLYYLVKYLDRNKFNCVIVTFDLKEMLVKKIRKEGIKVYHVPVARYYTPNAMRKALVLRDIIKEHSIDIVQTFHFKSDTYGALVARLSRVEHIISSKRDVGDFKNRIQYFLNRIINRYIDKVIVVADVVGDVVMEKERIPQNKITRIYNGVDLVKFSPMSREEVLINRMEMGIEPDDFVVGVVAVFRPEKKYDTFFNGIIKANEFIKQLKAIVVGYGPLLDHFKDYAAKHNLSDKIIFTGETDDPARYISVMDVACLVPGSNEGFSNAIIEKMAMGKPLVVTNVGGNAEAVVDGYNGIVIPPNDYCKLSEALIYLYDNPTIRQEMGRKSRKRAEQLFSMEGMIKNHEKLYEEVFSA